MSQNVSSYPSPLFIVKSTLIFTNTKIIFQLAKNTYDCVKRKIKLNSLYFVELKLLKPHTTSCGYIKFHSQACYLH